MLNTLSVSQYNNYIRSIFDAEELLHNVSIVGEIFGISTARTAVYFSLKDENGMIGCVSFYPSLFVDIKEGDKIIVTGSPNYYAKAGKLSFNVVKLEKSGEGDLFKAFLEMKKKLEEEGLFDANHKKQLPNTIKTIGVITSKEGAVIHDIRNVARRRDCSINIALYPVKVQGRGAELEIANAIEALSNFDGIDVIVVARGGGSLEDLSAYNTEIVARATYSCIKPIVSAVGHETDWTIIDFVSDLRAPTPSAAAELLTKNKSAELNAFNNTKNNFFSLFDRYIQLRNLKLQSMSNSLTNKTQNFISKFDYELGMLENSLSKLDPKAILKRGYAKVEQCGKVIDKAENVVLQSNLEIKFIDGSIIALPQEVKS